MILFLSILIGYLLGSINPAYFFGWLLKHQDIRTFGTKNAGGTNVLKNIGIAPGIITIIYDLLKGVLAIFIAWKLGVHDPWYLLAGLGAFLGHVFPFYLNFRGGQGVAVLMSLFFFSSVKLFLVISFPWQEFSALVVVVLSLLYIAYKGDVLGLATIPLLWLILIKLLILNPASWFYIAVIIAIFIYIFVINVSIIKKEGIVHLKDHTKNEMLHWRTIARPLAILIPIIYIYTSKEVILWILGILGLILIIVDLARLSNQGINLLLFRFKGVFKEKERLRFSSLTYFILANFLAILLFERQIAILAITFIIFGDLAAKFFGAQYSKRFIFGERSLEGFLAYFSFCLFFGVYVGTIFGISFWLVALGALAAALIDLFSVFGIDDNFTVALLSGGALEAIRFFIKI
ncbi:MAG: glycerol-3-phosphate acyltransferase [Patescibacteria group bacterium]|jgi:glycerol-3-phosphate acyltransferase PlsY